MQERRVLEEFTAAQTKAKQNQTAQRQPDDRMVLKKKVLVFCLSWMKS